MKLLTLNCHAWLEERQIEKIKTLAKTISENRYDVIALQEVNQPILGGILEGKLKENNFAVVLLAELQELGRSDYRMIWDCCHTGYEIYEEGLSIVTRHPIVEPHSFFVSNSEEMSFWKTRKIVGATLKIQEECIQVYSCHLGWWQDAEEPFMQQADRLLHNSKQEGLTLLLGDFNNNAFTTGEGYDYLMKQGLYDTFTLAQTKDEGITVKGNIDGWGENQRELRLDLVLANRPVMVVDSRAIFNGKNQEIISDHYGVAVEILLK